MKSRFVIHDPDTGMWLTDDDWTNDLRKALTFQTFAHARHIVKRCEMDECYVLMVLVDDGGQPIAVERS